MSITTPTKAPFGVGLLKGLGVTLKHLFKKPATQQYPHERPDLPPRTRGVIALFDENCTVCMLCARECPDWCIYIDSHKEKLPAQKEGGRERTRNALDRFAIDFALCMYCGICVEVCPFDALFWSPEFEYAEYEIDGLLHEMDRLREWADTVPPPPALDDGAESPVEVADAIAAKEKELEAARAKRDEAEAVEADPSASDGGGGAATPAGRASGQTVADVHVEGAGEQLDQEVYDEQIAAGKSERMARAKAKAAWVRAQKKAKMAEAEAEAEAPAQSMADVHVEGAGEQLDQGVYDEQIAAGKSERMARAKAKAAWVRAQKKAKMAEAEASGGGDEPAADAGASADGPPTQALADVHIEGAGEQLDQEVYDEQIAAGKSERIARAKAKAAWVRAQKRTQLDDADAGASDADAGASAEEGGS